MRSDSTRPAPTLSDADAAALDALLGDQAATPDCPTERLDAIERLLGLLEVPDPVVEPADRRLLVDVTFARVLRARDRNAIARLAPQPTGLALTKPDAEAIDALVAAEWQSEAGEGRAQRAHELLALLDSALEAPADRQRRIDDALARVQDEVDAQSRRLRFRPIDRPTYSRPRVRWRDISAIAAMFLIACSVFWPMVHAIRLDARRAAGQTNLQRASLGFGMFAADHDDRMPSWNHRGVDGLWWQVGTPEKSHSANLYSLVAMRYLPIASLASPGNPDAPTEIADPGARDWASSEMVSYSYQLFGRVVPRLTSTHAGARVVLADRSPIVERARMDLPIDPRANSANQSGFGQLVLFSDGRVRFFRSPELDNGDNIWLPRRLEAARKPAVVGTELPASRDDAFVGP